MPDFPSFMKKPATRIAPSSQYTQGVEGYVFDGADGSQDAAGLPFLSIPSVTRSVTMRVRESPA